MRILFKLLFLNLILRMIHLILFEVYLKKGSHQVKLRSLIAESFRLFIHFVVDEDVNSLLVIFSFDQKNNLLFEHPRIRDFLK